MTQTTQAPKKKSAGAASLVYFGNPVLRKRGALVSKAEMTTPAFKKFVSKMYDVCTEFEGVGVAAPQLGVSKQVFVMYVHKTSLRSPEKEVKEVFINPKITAYTDKTVEGWEGCLSLPKVVGSVPRAQEVELAYTTPEGKKVVRRFKDFEARIIQHETDHLNGVLYIDRMVDMKTLITADELKKMLKEQSKKKATKKAAKAKK